MLVYCVRYFWRLWGNWWIVFGYFVVGVNLFLVKMVWLRWWCVGVVVDVCVVLFVWWCCSCWLCWWRAVFSWGWYCFCVGGFLFLVVCWVVVLVVFVGLVCCGVCCYSGLGVCCWYWWLVCCLLRDWFLGWWGSIVCVGLVFGLGLIGGCWLRFGLCYWLDWYWLCFWCVLCWG